MKRLKMFIAVGTVRLNGPFRGVRPGVRFTAVAFNTIAAAAAAAASSRLVRAFAMFRALNR